MDKSPKPAGVAELQLIREGIRHKYAAYHARDRDTYPTFEFNSNRANYQPLRDSFENEFFMVRKIDRVNNHLHIPSLNTLALLFSDPAYVPGRKILNTCRSYAEGTTQPDDNLYFVAPTVSITGRIRTQPAIIGTAAGLVFLLAGLATYWFFSPEPMASGLVISRPYAKQVVPRLPTVEGRVTNAEVVWLVVHPALKNQKFYVQDPVKVNEDGTWKSRVFIGTPDHSSDGHPFEIRAYINPGGSYTALTANEQYEFDTWPETAELATPSVLVVRGAEPK